MTRTKNAAPEKVAAFFCLCRSPVDGLMARRDYSATISCQISRRFDFALNRTINGPDIQDQFRREENFMHRFCRPAATAFSIVCLVASVAMVSSSGAFAQAKKEQAKQAAPAMQAAPPAAAPEIKQIALTEKQVQGVLAAQKDIDAISEKLPDDPKAKPDPKVLAQLEDTAKKNGFANYVEYNDVIDNISLVLGGFDPQSKTYVGAEAVLKAQIAAVQADKKMPAKDKKAALEDLNDALKTPAPTIENKGNIELVTKYYDKLSDALSDEE
jgi:hypothetical protein